MLQSRTGKGWAGPAGPRLPPKSLRGSATAIHDSLVACHILGPQNKPLWPRFGSCLRSSLISGAYCLSERGLPAHLQGPLRI